jgi:hypothetical protein
LDRTYRLKTRQRHNSFAPLISSESAHKAEHTNRLQPDKKLRIRINSKQQGRRAGLEEEQEQNISEN